jgi:hypothetical protein
MYLADSDISGVFLRQRNAAGNNDIDSVDHGYIQAEIQAAFLGWLWSLRCPVINRFPPWLWYNSNPPLQFWNRLLGMNGLRRVDYYGKRSESRTTSQDPPIVCCRACVVDRTVVWNSARPEKGTRYETALVGIARCAGLSFLEMVIVETSDGIGVKELDPFPDVSRFCTSSGGAITEALVKLFTDSNRHLGSQ